jgi:hypothetical protein
MKLTTIQEIKTAVDKGETVFAGTTAYQVIRDNIGQYLIKCLFNNTYTALHGREGTPYENKLNASYFFALDPSQVGHPLFNEWERLVSLLEQEGLTRSDAQAVADMELCR